MYKRYGYNVRQDLYDIITEFAEKYGCRKFNIPENREAYDRVVDACIKAGRMSECNRYEYSTHNGLSAAIAYVDNRIRYCTD